ncbi:RHS repeat-associated core domain-containing protein, partial [Listeria rocourtiae]
GDKLTYDTNGNRLSDGTYTYTWDTADQLTAITKKGETIPFATYQYDDDNRRVEKTVHGQTTKYYYDGDSIDVLYETDGAGTVQRQYVYSDSNVRMAMKVGAKTVFYHYNAHGDVVALTNEAGDMVAEYSYDAWGNVLQATETTNEAKQNPFGYAGYTYDKEIGMYYLMARYYEPEQGIFISVDPDPGDEDDPLTMNSYNYANNNPVMHIDPDGHWVWFVVNAGFAIYDGYKSYKKTKSWKKAGIAAAKGALGGGKFKLGRKALKVAAKFRSGRYKQSYRSAKKVQKSVGGSLSRAKSGKGWRLHTKVSNNKTVTTRFMNGGSGRRKKPYYRISHQDKGSVDRYGNYSNNRDVTHINLKRGSHRNISKIIKRWR